MVRPTHANTGELPKRENRQPKGDISGLKWQDAQRCNTTVQVICTNLNQLVPTWLSSPPPPGSGNITGDIKKEQVVETTCGSHEKTSKDNLCIFPGKLPISRIPFPRKEFY